MLPDNQIQSKLIDLYRESITYAAIGYTRASDESRIVSVLGSVDGDCSIPKVVVYHYVAVITKRGVGKKVNKSCTFHDVKK